MSHEARRDDRGHRSLASSLNETSAARARGADRGAPASQDPSAAASTAVSTALRESADRSPLAIAIVEGPTHVIRYANAAFRVLTGSEETRVLGTALKDLIPPVAAALLDLLTRVREQQLPQADVEIACTEPEPTCRAEGWQVTVWPVGRAGGDRDVDSLAVQLRDATAEADEHRRHAATVAELQEVNERLVLSSLREQTLREQAQAASVAKSTFLATMSHELRTPLTAIIGYEELLADGITGPVTAAQRMQLARIKSCSDHLLELIDEILTLSRVEARQEVVRVATVHVLEMVEMTTALVTPMATAKGLTLTVDAPRPGPDAPALTLQTDAIKVRQILLNLLSNAVKYSDRGGITLSLREERERVVFEVRDTGIGIPPEHLEQIFDVFWQVRQTATRTVNGAGLGLSVSRRLAQLLGGNVTAESVMGQGSTFTFWLPMHGAVVAAEARAAR